MGEKCFSRFNGYEVKDAKAREDIEKLKDAYITPQMFGAVGDGSTDDTEAFEHAAEYLNENKGLFFVPCGDYVITRPITFSNHGIRVMGECKQSTYLQMRNNAYIHFHDPSRPLSGCKLQDISIYNPDPVTHNTGKGVHFQDVGQANIENVIIQGFYRGLTVEDTGNAMIKDVGVVSDVDYSVGIEHKNRSVSTIYLGCYVGFSGAAADTGIGFLANGEIVGDININYLDVGNGAHAVCIDGQHKKDGTWTTDINLYNIVADGQRSSCVDIKNINEKGSINLIGGWYNPIRGSGTRCINVQNCNNVTISNAVIQQLAELIPSLYGIIMSDSNNCLITNCQFLDMASCVYLERCDGVSVSGNKFKTDAKWNDYGIGLNLADCDFCSVTGNSIDGKFIYSVCLDAACQSTLITNNVVKNAVNALNDSSVSPVINNNIGIA